MTVTTASKEPGKVVGAVLKVAEHSSTVTQTYFIVAGAISTVIAALSKVTKETFTVIQTVPGVAETTIEVIENSRNCTFEKPLSPLKTRDKSK